jgi:hypothetical protein
LSQHSVELLYQKAEGGNRTPRLRKRGTDATLAKIESCTVPTMKISCGTGNKHFNFLVILGKESWLWLKAVLYALGQVTRIQLKAGT